MPNSDDDLRREPWEWVEHDGIWMLSCLREPHTAILHSAIGMSFLPVLMVPSVGGEFAMVPITPDHPVARALVKLPELIRIAESVAGVDRMPRVPWAIVDRARAVVEEIGEWEEATCG